MLFEIRILCIGLLVFVLCCHAIPPEDSSGCDDRCNPENISERQCTTSCGSQGHYECFDCHVVDECTAPEEVCNGQDDDCDGTCDNGFECCLGDTIPCTTSCGTQGTRICEDGCNFSECIPPEEICDGIDQNCVDGADDGCPCATDWYPEPLPTEWGDKIGDILAFDWDDIYVTSGKDIYHFDGQIWTLVYSATRGLLDFWAASPSEIFVTGGGGYVYFFDGNQWSEQVYSPEPRNCSEIYGISAQDVYITCWMGGQIYKYDGVGNWTASYDNDINLPRTQFSGLWGDDPNNFYAVGANGLFLRYDEGNWTQIQDPIISGDLHSIWGDPKDNSLFITNSEQGNSYILSHAGGVSDTWTRTRLYATLYSFWGTSSSRLFAYGWGGVRAYIYLFNGSSWKEIRAFSDIQTNGMSGTNDNNVYLTANDFSGNIYLYHRCGENW